MKKIFTWILKFAVAAALTLLFIEVFFRYSELFLPSIILDDPKLGMLRKPNAQIFQLFEGFCMGDVNQYGYYGPGYPPSRDSNSIRIALIGDSYVQGIELFDRYHFRNLLEKKLSAYTGRKVEVLNFGRGGIDMRGEYSSYKYITSDYNPDFTLFFIDNFDLMGKDDKPGPDYTLRNDSLIINYDFVNSEEFKSRTNYKFLRLTSFGNLLKRAYEYYELGALPVYTLGKLYPWPANDVNVQEVQKNDTDLYLNINSSVIKDLGSVNVGAVPKNIAIKIEKYPDYYDGIMRKYNLPVYDLAAYFDARTKSGEKLNYWKATNFYEHWNHEGHEAAAEFLFNVIKPFINRK